MAQRAIVRHAFFAVTGQETVNNEAGEPVTQDVKTYFTRENQHEALEKLSAEQIEAYTKSGSLEVYDDEAEGQPVNRPSPAPTSTRGGRRGGVGGVRPMQVDETEAR
jgi:hypothetical protein